jgi:hypothetical protein
MNAYNIRHDPPFFTFLTLINPLSRDGSYYYIKEGKPYFYCAVATSLSLSGPTWQSCDPGLVTAWRTVTCFTCLYMLFYILWYTARLKTDDVKSIVMTDCATSIHMIPVPCQMFRRFFFLPIEGLINSFNQYFTHHFKIWNVLSGEFYLLHLRDFSGTFLYGPLICIAFQLFIILCITEQSDPGY